MKSATYLLLWLPLVAFAQYPVEDTYVECIPEQHATDMRTNKNKLVVATWNLEWLFDNEPPYANRGPGTPQELQSRMNKFADAIFHMQPDVLNANEIEGCFMLNRFFNGSSPSVPPMYSVGVGDTDDSGTGQKLGLMSKVPFTSGMLFSKSRADTPAANSRCGWVRAKDTGASKHYVTRLQVENFGTVVVGAVHFKAGPNDPASCAQREGQALVFIDAVQSLVNATRDSSGSPPHVIVTGDFNDFTNDPAARDSESNDANSRVLQWIQERLDLRPVSTIVPQADRFTYSASSSFPASQLDHMLVSPSLFSQLHSVSINRSASIFPSLTDHAPLIAVFDVNTQRAVPPATAQCSWLPFQPPACGCGGTCPIMTPSPAATACPSTAAVQASPAAAAGAASEGSAGGVTAGTVALSAAATFFVGLAIGVVLMGARCSGSSCSWHGRPAGRTLGGKHRVARTAGPLAAESELPAFSSQVT